MNLFGKNWNRGIKFFAEMCATLQHPSSFPSSTPCRKTTGALTEICIQIGCPSFFFSICLLNSICDIQGRRSFFQQLIFHIQIEHETCYDLARTCTANILTVLSTAFCSVTFLIVIWLCMLQPKTATDLKLYSSIPLSVMGIAFGCNNHYQITVGNVMQPITVNWL